MQQEFFLTARKKILGQEKKMLRHNIKKNFLGNRKHVCEKVLWIKSGLREFLSGNQNPKSSDAFKNDIARYKVRNLNTSGRMYTIVIITP